MNKHYFMVLLSIFYCQILHAQTNYGFIAGALNNHHTETIDQFKKSNDYGLCAGLFYELKINSHFSLELNPLFSYTKDIIESDSSYRIINPYYHNLGGSATIYTEYQNYGILLPLLIKYKLNIFKPYLGIQVEMFSNNLKDRDHRIYHYFYEEDGKLSSYGDVVSLEPGTIDYGWLAGVECNLSPQIGIRLSYYRGMNEALVYHITKGIYNEEGGTSYTENTRKARMSLNLVYHFDWSKLKNIKKENNRSGKKPFSSFLKELY